MKGVKLKSSFLLFLFTFSTFLLFSSPLANFNSSKKSYDGNFSWELESLVSHWNYTDIILLSDSSSGNSENSRVVSDSFGNIHIVMRDPSSNFLGSGNDADIFYKYYNISTQSWSSWELVSWESVNTSTYCDLAVDNMGNAHVVWHEDVGVVGDVEIFYAYRNSTTGIWSSNETVSTDGFDASYYPKIAINSSNIPHIVWQDYSDVFDAGPDTDIFYRYRKNTGDWTGNINSTDIISTESDNVCLFPDICVDAEDDICGRMCVSPYLYKSPRSECPVIEFSSLSNPELFNKYRESLLNILKYKSELYE